MEELKEPKQSKQKDERRIQLVGNLEHITHNYSEGKFESSYIMISAPNNGHYREGHFYGLVPDTLLGKKIEFSQTYKENAWLSQSITYLGSTEHALNSKYVIKASKMNVSKEFIVR